jgi:YD repeat-containing protein
MRYLIPILLFLFSKPVSAQMLHEKAEYRSPCDSGERKLVSLERYDSLGRLTEGKRFDSGKTVCYYYDPQGRLILKVHMDSSGQIHSFNRIYYNSSGQWDADTLFSSDSTVRTVFQRSLDTARRQDLIIWRMNQGMPVLQYINHDEKGRELSNSICGSDQGSLFLSSWKDDKKESMQSFSVVQNKKELQQTEYYSYEEKGRLRQIKVYDERQKKCSHILYYEYR